METAHIPAPRVEHFAIANLLNKALSTPDEAAREKIYFRMQRLPDEEKSLIPVAYKPFSWAFSSKVKGFYVGVIGIPWLAETTLEA
ncbi:MAG: hypothetical protein ACRDPE_06150 [Solirubrobacterales bacterium]